MKTLILIWLSTSLIMMSGCSTGSVLLKNCCNGTRTDVFQVVDDGGAIPQGYARLRIFSSLKVLMLGDSLFGSKLTALVVNIDGQVIRISGMATEENSDARRLRDPEAGKGIRYTFTTKLQLNKGAHRLIVALPEKGVIIEKEVTLADGIENLLQLEPLYHRTPPRRHSFGETSFKEGILSFDANLNGNDI